jgi:acyl-coenzyme A synthetase/AMP-(fatty) acid ligase
MTILSSPRYFVSLAALPKTANQKVQKAELRRSGITSITVDRGPRGRKSVAATTS